MRIAANIAGALLGFLFAVFAAAVLLRLIPMQPQPAGSPAALFMGAFVPTGYLTFVKVCELAGGILVAIPRTRNFGLLVLGPIVINILAFHLFILKGAGLAGPPLIVSVLALFLLVAERKAFARLVN